MCVGGGGVMSMRARARACVCVCVVGEGGGGREKLGGTFLLYGLIPYSHSFVDLVPSHYGRLPTTIHESRSKLKKHARTHIHSTSSNSCPAACQPAVCCPERFGQGRVFGGLIRSPSSVLAVDVNERE